MTKFLDLRRKVAPQIKVVYKTVTKRRSWYMELTKVLVAVAIVGTVVWGISRADETQQADNSPAPQAFSISGLVSVISDTSFSIDNARSSAEENPASYTFNTNTIERIESNNDVPLQFSDIQIGDRVVVQGTFIDVNYTATRIFDFASLMNRQIIATTTDSIASSTSTTTDMVISTSSPIEIVATTTATATTTDDLASSTATTTTATTTPSFIDDVIQTVKDIVQNIVDTFTGAVTSDATTTSDTTTAPDLTTTDNNATSTE